MALTDQETAWLGQASRCYLATSMPDGSTRVTHTWVDTTWVDTDGERVLINSVRTQIKARNVERDPRMAVAIADPADPSQYAHIRGRVVAVDAEGAVDHIERLSQRYLGELYR